ncbi:MAG: dicarboxylate/amino acid:cation symporter [Candidatus Omnitrophica bacterium]|nr:dicarboxylate/amino acid:cation symporter [Candidatus Omnitrophota bacterium]
MRSGEEKTGKPLHWLLNPWTIFTGIMLGCVIGLRFKELADHLTILADIFLSLLQMCVTPVIVTSVIAGLARLVARRLSGHFLRRLLMIFVLGVVFASLVGLVAGILGKPGVDLDTNTRNSIGQMIAQYQVGAVDKKEVGAEGFSGFFSAIVPSNVFRALSNGQNLSILFFCILFGIALGHVRTPAGRATLSFMEGLYDAFQTLFSWILHLFPFGLCFLFASQLSHAGFGIINMSIKFMAVFYVTALMLFIFYNTLIWFRRRGSFFSPMIALREALVVAIGTSSSHAALPSAMRCLQENLKVDKGTANLVIPLGVSLHPQGKVMYYVLSVIFFAQIYGISLGFQGILITLIGSIFAAMGPGLGALVSLSLVLKALGLPSEPVVVFLIAINPVTDPVVALVSTFGNCTATVLAEEPVVLDQQKERL